MTDQPRVAALMRELLTGTTHEILARPFGPPQRKLANELEAELAAAQEDNKRLAADNAALVEVERIVREECARVCEAEYVDAEATGTAEDKAYNCAIEHCAAAIREGE